MNSLTIRIAGNGGCLNQGLPYNAFLMDDNFLVEAPPDIMPSLFKLGTDLSRLDTIYVSHLHGDHTFGLPFIIINKWAAETIEAPGTSLTIMGPPGVERQTIQLLKQAFASFHPCFAWMKEHVRFVKIGPRFKMDMKGLVFSCFKLEHPFVTYGFALKKGVDTVFAYVADTRWCARVERVLADKPRTVLMDMNGGEAGIHISRQEVINRGLIITDNASLYYGTHLNEEFESDNELIKCARPGDSIVLGY